MYVDLWVMANNLTIQSEAWNEKDWKIGDMELQDGDMGMGVACEEFCAACH